MLTKCNFLETINTCAYASSGVIYYSRCPKRNKKLILLFKTLRELFFGSFIDSFYQLTQFRNRFKEFNSASGNNRIYVFHSVGQQIDSAPPSEWQFY